MSDATNGPPSDETPGDEWNRRPVENRRAWFTVARKDVADAGRSWQLYVLTAVFTTAIVYRGLQPFWASAPDSPGEPAYTAHDGLTKLVSSIEVVVPLVALALGFLAISGERERGSLRTLLSFPISRREYVLGTLLGRIVVLWSTLGLGLAAAYVPMRLVYDGLDVFTYAGFAAMILLFGTVFVAMAVGISAAVRTRGRALSLTMGVFVLTTFLWRTMLWLQEFVTGVSPEWNTYGPNFAPGWYLFVDRARPITAWRYVVNEWVVRLLPDRVDSTPKREPYLTTPGPEPFYLDEWVLLVVLLAWGVVPLAIGYWRFRNAEIA